MVFFHVLIFFVLIDPKCVGMFSQIDVPGIPTTHDIIYVANSRQAPRFYRDFKHIDMVALLNDVKGLDWSTLQLKSMISFIFSKRLRHRNRINPWFNMTIQRAFCERDICYAV
jgi:hypothetical protein